jgi:hypothetical protein
MSFREPGWLLPVPYRYCKDQQANRANFHVLILSGHRQSLSCYNSKKKRLSALVLHLEWRSRADSNRCRSFCRALPSHSATGPLPFNSSQF